MSSVSNTPLLRQRLIAHLSGGLFCSGERLAAELALSRTAISKHIAALRRMGLAIDAVRGKGYRLRSPFELLDGARIATAIEPDQKALLESIELFPTLASTNDYLLRQPPLPTKRIVLAEQQTAGRGRQGRAWLAPAGSITLSLSWRFQRPPAAMPALTLAVAVAVVQALESGREAKIAVKWPNDIVYQGQKLAGILVEMRGESHGPVDIVLGVGVNFHLPREWAQQIDQPVTDMTAIYGGGISRNQLTADLISSLVLACQQFDKNGLAPFRQHWLQRDQYRHKPVVLRIADGLHRGVSEGIDENGALLLRQGQKLRAFHSGEIEQSRFES